VRKLSKQTVAAALFAAFLGLVSGCSNSKKVNDDTIAQDVHGKVAADPATKDSNVNVSAKDGKVTVTGSVKDQAAQQKVEQIAHEEPGVTSVEDRTEVIPPPEPPKPIIVPAGTTLTVTVEQTLSSKTSQAGQPFAATLARGVTIDGQTAIPKGSKVIGRVVSAKERGKIKGEGELSITLTSIAVGGRDYPIQTGTLSSTVKGKGKRTAATTGGGAAGGALIGGLAGGGKGAGIGALVGGAAGFIGGAATGNKQVEIPVETPLSFALSAELTLPPNPPNQ
jgi:hypothetical protein